MKNLKEFYKIINSGYTLVDFYTDWCGPCKMMEPALDQIAELRSNLKIVKVNIEVYPKLVKKYQVMSIPTLILFKDGEVMDKYTGLLPQPKLEEWIDKKR